MDAQETDTSVKDLKFHDAANIFPLIDGDEFYALVKDIRTNGLRESIKLLDGMVLDIEPACWQIIKPSLRQSKQPIQSAMYCR
jgi:hypothetical protein